jgi:hypothetical protein
VITGEPEQPHQESLKFINVGSEGSEDSSEGKVQGIRSLLFVMRC